MSYVHFMFATSAFHDSADIRAQSINDMCGHSLATWLVAALETAGFDTSDVWAEDHGWDFSVKHLGAKYLCACCIIDGDEPFEGHVTMSKSRSIMDRLKGRGRLTDDDPVAAGIQTALESSRDVRGLVRDQSR